MLKYIHSYNERVPHGSRHPVCPLNVMFRHLRPKLKEFALLTYQLFYDSSFYDSSTNINLNSIVPDDGWEEHIWKEGRMIWERTEVNNLHNPVYVAALIFA